ncbi:MAG: hypothetical protein FWG21_00460 [Oscillospiraceae bacterium]|nr:hypothetical protein [Oscillospiraceae bacterium]
MLTEEIQGQVVSTSKNMSKTLMQSLTSSLRFRLKGYSRQDGVPLGQTLNNIRHTAVAVTGQDLRESNSLLAGVTPDKLPKTKTKLELFGSREDKAESEFNVRRVSVDFVIKKFTKTAAEKNAKLKSRRLPRFDVEGPWLNR